MQIKVTKGADVIYQQMVDDDSRMNQVVQTLMGEPAGSEFTVTLTNKGHDMTLRFQDLNLDRLVRRVNGIMAKEKKEVAHGV